MPLIESEYCAEQISVPPKLPMILKQFCKSAIRTQPYDLLKWSSAYFHALANGEEPPSKLRLEYPPACSAYGLTIGFLKVLLRQLGADYNKSLPLELIFQRWDYLCLDRRDANLIVVIGRFRNKCQIKKFLSIAVGLLTRSLAETMIMICELFTHEPDGGSAMIPLGLFMEIYGYLAGLRCDGGERGTSDDSICICEDSATTLSSVPSDLNEEEKKSEVASQIGEAAPESGEGEETMKAASIPSQQDTAADIDLDFDSFQEEDAPSGLTLRSFGEETEGSFLHEGQASCPTSERTISRKTPSSEETGGEKEGKKIEEDMGEAKASVSTKSSEQKVESEGSSEKTEESSEPYEKCYPDIPGIGRRLVAEEVATVAIWMSECARRQGGMVGPRNIRHLNCPPLEGTCFARSDNNC